MEPKAFVPVAPTEKKDYEVLIDEFVEIDTEAQALVDKFNTGSVLFECVPTTPCATVGDLVAAMQGKFLSFMDYLRSMIEKRNSLLQNIASAMRSAVQASESTVRGVDGKASFLRYGPFEVNSKTSRSFDPDTLFTKLKEKGLYNRLFEVTTIDPKTGKQLPAVRSEWVVEYTAIKNWLRESNQEDVIDAAYEEEEGTAAVTGPKEIGLLGGTVKKGGKK